MTYNNNRGQAPIMNDGKDTVKQAALLCIVSTRINRMRMNVCTSIACFFFFLFIAALPLYADGTKTHRGEFPKCQATCLAAHTKKMEKLMDTYGQGGDKITFQDGVDTALSEYKVCIVNCRDPIPVK